MSRSIPERALLVALLKRECGEVTDLVPLQGGLVSTVLGFRAGGDEYVVRVGSSIEAYKKDAYVSRQFGSAEVPIPEVLRVGQMDSSHPYCIARRARGTKLHDAPLATRPALIAAVTRCMTAITNAPLPPARCYGVFESSGGAPSATWREYVESRCGEARRRQIAGSGRVDMMLADKARAAIEANAEFCTEDRSLVHGDFGSFNILCDGDRITGVIDWDHALYGDPLYDVANVLFWQEQQLAPLIVALEQTLDTRPNAVARIRCCQAMIVLDEFYAAAMGGVTYDLTWVENRARELLLDVRTGQKGLSA